MADR
jgi:hypothetical protein